MSELHLCSQPPPTPASPPRLLRRRILVGAPGPGAGKAGDRRHNVRCVLTKTCVGSHSAQVTPLISSCHLQVGPGGGRPEARVVTLVCQNRQSPHLRPALPSSSLRAGSPRNAPTSTAAEHLGAPSASHSVAGRASSVYLRSQPYVSQRCC